MRYQEFQVSKQSRKKTTKNKDKDRVFEGAHEHARPYKKPKTNFKHFIEDQLSQDDVDDL